MTWEYVGKVRRLVTVMIDRETGEIRMTKSDWDKQLSDKGVKELAELLNYCIDELQDDR